MFALAKRFPASELRITHTFKGHEFSFLLDTETQNSLCSKIFRMSFYWVRVNMLGAFLELGMNVRIRVFTDFIKLRNPF